MYTDSQTENERERERVEREFSERTHFWEFRPNPNLFSKGQAKNKKEKRKIKQKNS